MMLRVVVFRFFGLFSIVCFCFGDVGDIKNILKGVCLMGGLVVIKSV